MRRTRALVFFATVAVMGASSATTVEPIPSKGNALSFLHQIIAVHTAKSQMDEVRLYELCASGCAVPTLALQVVADNRLPAGKMTRVTSWVLDYGLRRVDSISLRGTVVSIEGWSYEQGALSCTATFSFSERGVLSETLQDAGCAKAQR